jgi:hypothetical protein
MNRNQLPYLFNQLLHIAIRTIHDIVLEIIDINQFKNLLCDDDLFIECQEFIDLRYKFETRWLDLTKQRVLLENCRNQVDNEHVRNMLIQAYEASSSIYKDDKLLCKTFVEELEIYAKKAYDITQTNKQNILWKNDEKM